MGRKAKKPNEKLVARTIRVEPNAEDTYVKLPDWAQASVRDDVRELFAAKVAELAEKCGIRTQQPA